MIISVKLYSDKQKFKNTSKRFLSLGKMPLRHKITITSILLTMLPLLFVGFYFYSNLSKILTKNAYDSLDQLIRQTNENIESSLSMIDITYTHMLISPTLRQGILEVNDEYDEYDMLRKKMNIESELKYNVLFDNAWKNRLIKTIYLFLNESTYCSVSRSLLNIDVVNRNNIEIYKKTLGEIEHGNVILPPSNDDQVIYYVSDLYNINTAKIFGKLIIGIDENVLFEKYSHILVYEGAKAFIFNQEGIIYSHPDKSLLGKKAGNSITNLINYHHAGEARLYGQAYYVTSKKIENTDLIFTIGIPKSQIFSKFNRSISTYLLFGLLVAMASLGLSLYLSLQVSKVIQRMLDSINKVKEGNYTDKMPSYKSPELNLLSQTFNKMTGELRYLINQVYKEQLLLKESELKFLQAQMNPHFLFNTLATIGYKARLGEYEQIHQMVTSLSQLLQASIYTNTESRIPIRQEIEYVKFYLYLQKIRYEDKLEYKINITNDKVLDYYLPKLCLEPIVENAVVHGLEKKVGKGTVIVNIYTENDSVFLEVIDDGNGFDSSEINIDEPAPAARSDKIHCGIGLANTNRRIKLIYGQQYGIHIESSSSKGSRVIIHIPIDRG